MTAKTARRHVRSSTILAALAGLLLVASVAPAQDEPKLSVVIADDALVRSGAADSYYPFGTLRSGDLVLVTGEKFKWARVATVGPAFKELFGFIKYPKSETSRFHLSPDGRTGLTLGRVDILAPNLNTNFNPKDSWKPVARLDAEQQVVVLETFQTEREIVHRVMLPKTAVGWMSTAALTRATPSQIAAWDAAVNDAEEAAVKVAEPAVDESAEQVLARSEPAVQPVVESTSPSAPEEAVIAESVPAPEQVVDEEVIDVPDTPPTALDEEPPAPQPAPPAPPAARSADKIDPELAALEQAYETLSGTEEMPTVADIRALQFQYEELSERKAEVRRVALFSRARAKQLKIWADLQERRAELLELRTRVGLSATDTEEAAVAMDANRRYVVMGRLAVSRVYDGQKLPKLFRLQEPGSGRTVAYLRPGDEADLVGMLGQLIGIVGEKSYDPGLRLTLVSPRRIDLLAPRG